MARSPLLDYAFGYMPAQMLYAAAELRLADALAGGAHTSDELAARTGTHPQAMHRLLRALACLGVLTQEGPDRFVLTEEGRRLRSDAPDSVHGLLGLFGGPDVWKSWGDLLETLRTGEPAWNRVTGMTSFEFFEANPDRSVTFNKAMSEHTRDVAPAFIEGCDFTRFGTIADLGGGDGTLLAAILRAVPAARGVLFDLPVGLKEADVTLEAAGVADRCELVAGDFFESVPAGADAYVLKSVIHDWDDEQSVAILRNCRAAAGTDAGAGAGTGAKVLLLETVVPEVITPEHTGIVMGDMNMLVCTGGRERTEEEFRRLLEAAGFALTGITGQLRPSNYRIIEGTPV
ncbi:methyltransferase [Spirillospora sp. NPDC048911]|uniref:methyltransferase n=1 Tax=Spirillospora sp. NPDC048911 TaxID=3364527 RepID=UPI0037206862